MKKCSWFWRGRGLRQERVNTGVLGKLEAEETTSTKKVRQQEGALRGEMTKMGQASES